MCKYGWIVVLVMATSACGGSPTSPSVRDCEYYDTGTLVLVNLAETLTPRDAYVDGRFVAVVDADVYLGAADELLAGEQLIVSEYVAVAVGGGDL